MENKKGLSLDELLKEGMKLPYILVVILPNKEKEGATRIHQSYSVEQHTKTDVDEFVDDLLSNDKWRYTIDDLENAEIFSMKTVEWEKMMTKIEEDGDNI